MNLRGSPGQGLVVSSRAAALAKDKKRLLKIRLWKLFPSERKRVQEDVTVSSKMR